MLRQEFCLPSRYALLGVMFHWSLWLFRSYAPRVVMSPQEFRLVTSYALPGIMPHENLCVAKSDAVLGNIPTLRQPWFDNWYPFSRDEILNETQCVENSFEVCTQDFCWIHSTAVSRDIFGFFGGYTNS